MTHTTGHGDLPAESWGAQMLVSEAVPDEIADMRAALDHIEGTHAEDAACVAAARDVRAALDRLTLALVRYAVIQESTHGERRPGLRSIRGMPSAP